MSVQAGIDALVGLTAHNHDEVKRLRAALVRIAGTGRIPPGSVKFPNPEYRAGYCCGYEDQADIAREVLTANNPRAESGK